MGTEFTSKAKIEFTVSDQNPNVLTEVLAAIQADPDLVFKEVITHPAGLLKPPRDRGVDLIGEAIVAMNRNNAEHLPADRPFDLDDVTDGLRLAFVVAWHCGEFAASDYGASADGDRVTITAGGSMTTLEVKDLLILLAKHGATGSMTCDGPDDDQWRWSLVDGTVREDDSRILFDGDLDTAGWIAQLQAGTAAELDRVRVVPSEADGVAQIAAWCRQDHRVRCADQGCGAGRGDPRRRRRRGHRRVRRPVRDPPGRLIGLAVRVRLGAHGLHAPADTGERPRCCPPRDPGE